MLRWCGTRDSFCVFCAVPCAMHVCSRLEVLLGAVLVLVSYRMQCPFAVRAVPARAVRAKCNSDSSQSETSPVSCACFTVLWLLRVPCAAGGGLCAMPLLLFCALAARCALLLLQSAVPRAALRGLRALAAVLWRS